MEFSLAPRLRLFLPPSDDLLSRCRCGSPLSSPDHFLLCRPLYDLRRIRHDRLVRLLASQINSAGYTLTAWQLK